MWSNAVDHDQHVGAHQELGHPAGIPAHLPGLIAELQGGRGQGVAVVAGTRPGDGARTHVFHEGHAGLRCADVQLVIDAGVAARFDIPGRLDAGALELVDLQRQLVALLRRQVADAPRLDLASRQGHQALGPLSAQAALRIAAALLLQADAGIARSRCILAM